MIWRYLSSSMILGVGSLLCWSCGADAQSPQAQQIAAPVVPPARTQWTIVKARDAAGLRAAIAQAKPGTRIQLAPGEYASGNFFNDIHGEAGRPIVIEAADAQNPPLFKGGTEAIHLSKVSYVTLLNLNISGASGNGINIDDGGAFDAAATHHVVLHGLKISDIGPTGNRDGIKLSGVKDFRVQQCIIERWGKGSGSGIDMVGCHRGLIHWNKFRHVEGNEEGNAVQTKGGTRDIKIRTNYFEHAGGRAINIGGSTGFDFFRPSLKSWPAGEARYEAKNILVEGNAFVGSSAPVAFVGVDGAVVRFNTIYKPGRWAMRILQETRAPGFAPSRNGEFTDNIVVFSSNQWAEGGVNIGTGTEPKSFKFARNFWYSLDAPQRSRPTLPTREVGGIYGRDPLFQNADAGNFRLKSDSPARKMGISAFADTPAAALPIPRPYE